MMNFKVILSVTAFFIDAVHCAIDVPVVAWGTGLESINYQVPALQKLSSSKFHDFVKKLSVNAPPAVVTFVEGSLSVEDFSWKDDNENSVYPSIQKHMEDDSSAQFIPSVQHPLKALESLEEEGYVSTTDLKTLSEQPKNLFMVNLDDGKDGETRVEMLIRHDKIIEETCSEIGKTYKRVVCVLTGNRNSWIESEMAPPNRHLLDVPSTDNGSAIVFYLNDVGMVYTKGIVLLINDEICVLDAPTTQPTKGQGSIAVFVPNNCTTPSERMRLVLGFSTDNQTWSLSTITVSIGTQQPRLLNESSSTIGASIGSSYHTPAVVTFEGADNKTRLNFISIQAEYFSKPKTDASFGPADDSVTFFTIPIISGLFVSSLMVSIVLLGLSMIFDIKTMDQFDDPKGKTVTINASE